VANLSFTAAVIDALLAKLDAWGILSGTVSMDSDIDLASGRGISFDGGDVLGEYSNHDNSWTPTGNGITFSTAAGRYSELGDKVFFTCFISFPTTSDASPARFSLPFTSNSTDATRGSVTAGYGAFPSGETSLSALVDNDAASVRLYAEGNTVTNAQMSELNLYFSGWYMKG